jgi:sugar lactone lactonase YvrE
MSLHGSSLYVVDRRGVHIYDAETGDHIASKTIPGTQFLNDITFDGDGIGYISDSRASRIYRLRDGRLESWLEGGELSNPNGLHVIDDMLYVGNSGDGSVKKVSLESGDITTLATIGNGRVIDGLTSMPDGTLLASDHAGCIFRIKKNGTIAPLLDRRTTLQYCADFTYIPALRLIVLPSLMANTVTAFELSDIED